jgi:hypothetical protein
LTESFFRCLRHQLPLPGQVVVTKPLDQTGISDHARRWIGALFPPAEKKTEKTD